MVQKTQRKPPFDNRNFSFPKSATKKIANITKDLYQSRRGEKTDQFLLQKIGIVFFFRELASNANLREAVPHNKSKAVVGKETTKSSATSCTYTNQTANHLLLNYSSSFFHFCPVILNFNRLPRSKSSPILNTTCKNLGREKTGTGSD